MGSGRDSSRRAAAGALATAGLLAAAGFALLAADLQWANSHVLWTVGFLLNALWVALLVQLVLTFPEGRPWSRVAPFVIAGACATVAGQLVGAVFFPTRATCSPSRRTSPCRRCRPSTGDPRDRHRPRLLVLLGRRLLVLRGPAQRAQAPLLAAAAFSVSRPCPGSSGWSPPGTPPREPARPGGRSRCSSRSPSLQGSCGRGCAAGRRPTSSSSCGRRGRPACASASPAHWAIRHSTLPIGSTTAVTWTLRAGRSSCRWARTGQSRW